MTAPQLQWAVDATHINVGKVPASAPIVIGYASGTSDIQWTPEDWARFTGRKISNFQGYGAAPALGAMQELDVEARALSPSGAANLVAHRVMAGYQWTGIYGSDSMLEQTAHAVQMLGNSIWVGHVLCRLADWSLNESEAAAKVGTQIHGMTCAGVQWASDTSNPHTTLPGTSLVLDEVHCDLSILMASYPDLLAQFHPAPPPPGQAPPPVLTGTLVMLPSGSAKFVHSKDNGANWA